MLRERFVSVFVSCGTVIDAIKLFLTVVIVTVIELQPSLHLNVKLQTHNTATSHERKLLNITALVTAKYLKST